MKNFRHFAKLYPIVFQMKNYASYGQCFPMSKPNHLICFKQWTAEMVMNIISSAINLKYCYKDTHCKRMNVLQDCKIMVLQEVNEPVLNMAVSKAATLLGAYDCSIIDHVIWNQDYNGSIFSYMADAIFVATSTHHCIQRFANQATVPVICMRSRTHASIQALSTIMAIIEEFGEMRCLNIGFIGPPHPVLNSYLLLCPMLGANIKFCCCCPKCPVTPLLYKASKELKDTTRTDVKTCKEKNEVLQRTDVVIAGPTIEKKEKIQYFTFSLKDIQNGCNPHWIFFHSCPRGAEVMDNLFYHENTRTFKCFENMQFIAAALMANGVKGHIF
ncbi:ornithine transcarbamylase, mitochondrial-like [Cydia strobilella]|uniref:ornithine transcarbamylase, mitochondrial-like n=1 Tax=Cydia strobilella TaxID=1100964 RepID=UPI00300578B3